MLNGGKSVQEKPEANLALGPTYFKGKQKGKGKKKLTKSSVPPRVDRKKAKKSKDPKKIKCFFQKGKSMKIFVVEAFLVEESIDNWVIDSEATNYVCVSL
ncbi:hypothetical protein Goarm_014102 [Gossypium armourianum]|uniref:Uncharacterized protein n=1 Tax=Gossypium armourianum TaxID=34283 RepID=A0A7J9J5A6_9ROSI|nr:hypothetical protein [Gossypium armourianum]